MSRESENMLLLLTGVSAGMITVTGVFTRYVKPSLQPWLLVTAGVVTVLALIAIVRDIRRGSVSDPQDDHGAHDDHVHRGSIGWLLLVPVVVLIFVTPPALLPGALVPTVTAVSTEVLRRPFPPLPAGRAPEVSIPNIMIRAAQDSAGTLNDRLITVIGFTLPDGDRTDLGRFSVSCCAADARLARVHLDGAPAAEAASYPEHTWLRVEGTLVPADGDGDSTAVPTLRLATVTRIDPPDNVYA